MYNNYTKLRYNCLYICFQIFDVCLTLVLSMLITISFVELLSHCINLCITFLKTDIDYTSMLSESSKTVFG